MQKIIIKTLLIFYLTAGFILNANAEFRDVNSKSIIGDTPILNTQNTSKMNVKNSVKDGNKKLYGVVGKSQILNFDKGIKRVSIADPNLADIIVLSPKQLMVNGKKAGSTSLIFWGSTNTPVFYNLVIQPDADDFLDAVGYIAPNEDISIIFNNEGAVLSGYVSSSDVREKIANLAKAYNIKLTDITESPSKQVLLEVRVTEISKNLSRDLGVGFGAGDSANVLNKVLPTSKFSQLLSSGGLSYLLSLDNGKLAMDIQAAETKGDIKILAEPKLLAVNNEDASFNVGNEVPIPSEIGQYGQVSYEFKKTGVILNFKPTIMEKSGRVRLKLAPEVSEIDRSAGLYTGDNLTVPGFKTRKVETTVELMDGETLIIAGLLSNTTSKTRTQVPVLGNIPFLGVLFGITNDVKNDSELVIFITPRIVDNSVKVDSI